MHVAFNDRANTLQNDCSAFGGAKRLVSKIPTRKLTDRQNYGSYEVNSKNLVVSNLARYFRANFPHVVHIVIQCVVLLATITPT